MNAKELLVKTAASLQLDACGAASVNFSEKLSERLTEAGTIPFAPADIKERIDTEALLPGSRSFFVILFPYRPSHKEEGNIALYARGLDYHKMIQSYLDRIIGVMRNAYPEARFRGLADTSPMVDRWLAYAAGLGFFGKNHCIINPKYGSFFTIGSILTTLELSPDSPLDLSCGECRECFYHCPGHVIREDSFDVWHCKSYLTQKKEALTEEEEKIIARTPLIFGCDECQLCCPFNKNAAVSPLPEIRENRLPFLTREKLESYSNRSFDKEMREYSFAWRGRKVLLRNLDLTEKDSGK